MGRQVLPWSAGLQAANEMTMTSIVNLSKATAASTALLLRLAGTGTVAGAVALRAVLDAVPAPPSVPARDAGEAPASPAARAATPQPAAAREAVERLEEAERAEAERVEAERAEAERAEAERVEAERAEAERAEAERAEAERAEAERVEAERVEEPPVENWDHLTLASARARLRKLTLDELLVLLAYEKGHGDRTSIVTMLENRIRKVQEDPGR